jgi:hypothetical protein
MKTEITSLVLTSTFTGLLWVPYMLNRMAVRGIPSTVGYPVDPPPLSPWASACKQHMPTLSRTWRCVSALVLAAQMLNISTPATVFAGSLYLWSRVAHAVTYTLGVPWLRTLAFMGGFAAQMLVAWQVLGA